MLLSGQRIKTLTLSEISHITITDSCCTFHINSCVKQTKPENHLAPFEIPAYPPEISVCTKAHLSKYLEMTKDERGKESRLLISFQKPFKPVTVDTITRWIRYVMAQAGIVVTRFKPYSGRGASAKSADVSIDTILTAAGWSRKSTFAKFYNKTILQPAFFGQGILEAKL